VRKFLVGLLFIPVMAHAEFFTGNDLLAKMNGDAADRIQAIGYVQGVFDVYVHVTICPPNGGRDITAGQIRDMIKNYLTNSPATRHKTAESLIHEAFNSVWPCQNNRGNNRL
jgi:hypothetical protein